MLGDLCVRDRVRTIVNGFDQRSQILRHLPPFGDPPAQLRLGDPWSFEHRFLELLPQERETIGHLETMLPYSRPMTLRFYYGSGSPFAWRVWLALEHKRAPYEPHLLAFSAGDLRKPEFVAINPRKKVPAILDGDFALFESSAIMEYVEERFPEGPALFPGDVHGRALIRRLIREADLYLGAAYQRLVAQLFVKPAADWDLDEVAAARTAYLAEAEYFERALSREWFGADRINAADFTLYPFFCGAHRFEKKKPDLALTASFGPNLRGWMKRIEALPYYEKTYPPHWKQS